MAIEFLQPVRMLLNQPAREVRLKQFLRDVPNINYSIRLKTWPVENKKGNLGEFLIDFMNENFRKHGYIYKLVFICIAAILDHRLEPSRL